MTSAQQYQTTNSQYNVAYNMAIFTFANAGIDPVFPPGCSTSSCTPSNNLSAAGTAASAVDVIRGVQQQLFGTLSERCLSK